MPTLVLFSLLVASLAPSSIFPVAATAGEGGANQDAVGGVSLRGASRHGRRLDHNVGVRHASAHLSYTSPLEEGYPVAWYNSLTPKHSSESTFFATNTQGFGYMGLQQAEERGMWFKGIAIFSIWDAGCNEVMDEAACPLDQQAEIVECGEMAQCSRFGGEGTGFKSMIRFDEWELEQSYGFLVQAVSVSQDKVRYEGYFHAPELGGWVLISKIQVNVGTKPWYLHGMGSFVEQWDERSGEDVRWGRFGPAFVQATTSDAWAQIQRASFSHTTGAAEDATHVHANVTNGGQQWGMGIGGSLVKGVGQSTVLSIYQASAVPPELELFSQLRREGRLPGGCPGGTCTWTQIKGLVQEAFSKTYFPVTAIALVAVLCICCSVVCSCRRRKQRAILMRDVQSPDLSTRSDAVAAPDLEAQEVNGQPSAPDSVGAVVQDFIEPICQGAVAVSERVAQAAEEHLPPQLLRDQPTMADALDAVVQGVIDPICQGAVAVAGQVAQAAEEHLPPRAFSGQPTMREAFDAVVQGVVDPICQGAVAVAEQVAQAVEPGASSPSNSRAGSPTPKPSPPGAPLPGPTERTRSLTPGASRNGSRSIEHRGSPNRLREGSPSPGPSPVCCGSPPNSNNAASAAD